MLGFVLEIVRVYLLHTAGVVHAISVYSGKMIKDQNKGRIFS